MASSFSKYVAVRANRTKNNIVENKASILRFVSICMFILSPFVTIVHRFAYPDCIYGTIAIGIIWIFICYILFDLSRFYGVKNYNDLPIPSNRFTSYVGDGEVVIENGRIQELIMFTYEYENFLENNGYI